MENQPIIENNTPKSSIDRGVSSSQSRKTYVLVSIIIFIIILVSVSVLTFYIKSKGYPKTMLKNVNTIDLPSKKAIDSSIKFNGYITPVSTQLNYSRISADPYIADAEKYLQMWKMVFQKVNGISDEYFNKYIFVDGVEISITGEEKKIFVDYSFKLDWASAGMRDYFSYSKKGVDHDITLDELLKSGGAASGPFYNADIDVNKYFFDTFISKFRPITKIVTKDQMEKEIRKAVPVDAEYRIYGGGGSEDSKDPIVRVFATVNYKENECIRAGFSLETGKSLYIDSGACRIY